MTEWARASAVLRAMLTPLRSAELDSRTVAARQEASALVAQARVAAEDSGEHAVVALLAAAERKLRPRGRRGATTRSSAAADGDPRHREGSADGHRDPPPSPPCRLAAVTLGPFRLYQDGHLVDDWHGSRGQRIAKYLLAHQQHPVPRERLMELLWPETDPEVGRRNLHQAVYSLRRTLRRRQPDLQHIVFENDCYCLNPELEVWCDSDEFERRIAEGARLARDDGLPAQAAAAYADAELLYGGDYLEDTPFEEWALARRDYLAARHTEAMHDLARLNLALGRVDEAIACARRLLVRETADEVAHQLIIRGQLAAGRRGDALRQYRSCAEALDRDTGRPALRDRGALRAAHGGDGCEVQGAAPPLGDITSVPVRSAAHGSLSRWRPPGGAAGPARPG